MIIEKSTIEKILAFTLAEVLITMMVIVLMTLASIPVIKNSKEFRESAKDKNYWMAFYDQDEKLRVFTDLNGCNGDCPAMVEGDIAKFYPPEGVTRFNVTVVGGGGGGAAGMAGGGQSKVFFPESTDQSFVPAREGIYQIIAIGGGGGGGGGAIACDGGGGYSGGIVVAQAKLTPDEVYAATAGIPGTGGVPQKPLSFIMDILAPVMWVAAAATGVFTGGAGLALFGAIDAAIAATMTVEAATATVATIIKGNQPEDRMDGGGYGFNSVFTGVNADGGLIEIVACGGGGGAHVRKKAVWKCKETGGQEGCADYRSVGKQSIKANGVISYSKQDPWKEGKRKKKSNGYICKSVNGSQVCHGDLGKQLPTLLKDIVPSQFGNGGRGGNYRKTGSMGQGGIVLVEEVAVYGGGGGQAGAVSFYSYTKSPLEGDEEYVEVVPGKGGLGGKDNGQEGEDGMFSRFGNRIIADGGIGGDPRATGVDPESGVFEAEGEDGIVSAIPSNLSKKIVETYSSLGVELLDQAYGGLRHEKGSGDDKFNGMTYDKSYITLAGTGGGGGGAESDGKPGGDVKAGSGGNGASGIVLVTW